MFNPKVAEIYDAKTVEVFKPYADRMEREGRRVLLSCPAKQVEGQVFPCFVGIESCTEEDTLDLYNMYEVITEGRPEFEEDSECITGGDYEGILDKKGAIELWVK